MSLLNVGMYNMHFIDDQLIPGGHPEFVTVRCPSRTTPLPAELVTFLA